MIFKTFEISILDWYLVPDFYFRNNLLFLSKSDKSCMIIIKYFYFLQSQSHSAVIKPRFQELIGKMRKKFKTPVLDANQSISSIGVNGVSSEIEDAEKLHGL